MRQKSNSNDLSSEGIFKGIRRAARPSRAGHCAKRLPVLD
jgi:hypothetical protein